MSGLFRMYASESARPTAAFDFVGVHVLEPAGLCSGTSLPGGNGVLVDEPGNGDGREKCSIAFETLAPALAADRGGVVGVKGEGELGKGEARSRAATKPDLGARPGVGGAGKGMM